MDTTYVGPSDRPTEFAPISTHFQPDYSTDNKRSTSASSPSAPVSPSAATTTTDWMMDYVNDLLGESLEVSSSTSTVPVSNQKQIAGGDDDPSPPSTEHAVFQVLKDFLEANNNEDATAWAGVKKNNRKTADTQKRASKQYRLEKALQISKERRQGSIKKDTDDDRANNLSLMSMIHDRPQAATSQKARLVERIPYRSNICKGVVDSTAMNARPRSKSESGQLAAVSTTSTAGMATPTKPSSLTRLARSKSAGSKKVSWRSPKEQSPNRSVERRSRESTPITPATPIRDDIERIDARLAAIDQKLERMQEEDVLRRVEDMLDSEL